MAISLPPELEHRVTVRARELRRDPADVLAEIVESALADDADDLEALRQAVADADARFEAGEGIDHDDAMAELDEHITRRFGPRAVGPNRQ